MTTTHNAAIYLRVSKDDYDRGLSPEYQLATIQKYLAQHPELKIDHDPYNDPDLSGFKTNVIRPEFNELRKRVFAGEITDICLFEVDRLSRRPLHMEEFIEWADETDRLVIHESNGTTYDLKTDIGILSARFKAQTANTESRIKSRRIIASNIMRAEKGIATAGRRLYGYDDEDSMAIREDEAEVVRAVYRAYLSGASMASIVDALNGKRKLPDVPKTVSAGWLRWKKAREREKALCKRKGWTYDPKRVKAPKKYGWASTSIKHMLLNPKYAGYSVRIPAKEYTKGWAMRWTDYIVRDSKGDYVDGKWEPIIDRETWWAVHEKLTNPQALAARTTNRSGNNKLTHMGTGFYRCGICGQPMACSSHSYRCDGHVHRTADVIDRHITTAIHKRLAAPDIAGLAPARDDGRLTEIADELTKHRGKVAECMAQVEAHPAMAPGLEARVLKEQAAIEALETERAVLLQENPTAAVVGSKDPVAAFDALDVHRKREVLRFFFEVTLYRHETGNHSFDGSDVGIRWRENDGSLGPEIRPEQTLQTTKKPDDAPDTCPKLVERWLAKQHIDWKYLSRRSLYEYKVAFVDEYLAAKRAEHAAQSGKGRFSDFLGCSWKELSATTREANRARRWLATH